MIVDDDLKPWLLEVNASPSLTANTKDDYMLKTEMLHGMLDVVDMEVHSMRDFYSHYFLIYHKIVRVVHTCFD